MREIDEIKDAAGVYRRWALEARKKYIELRLRQDPEIRDLYIRAADRVAREIRKLALKTPSSYIRKRQLEELEAALRAEADRLTGSLTKAFEQYIEQAVDAGVGYSQSVTLDLFDLFKKAGMDTAGLRAMFATVNRQAVEACWARTKKGLFLSDRIWKQGEDFRNAIRDLIQESVAIGQDAVKTARMLQQYVRQGAMTLARDYPEMMKRMKGRIPGNISYEALRLARTEMTAAFGEGTIAAARVSPSYIGMKWVLSKSHPVTDICDTLAEHDEGLGRGVYSPGNEPPYPAHPNCLCVLVSQHEQPEKFGERLKKWRDDPTSDQELEKRYNDIYQKFDDRMADEVKKLLEAKNSRKVSKNIINEINKGIKALPKEGVEIINNSAGIKIEIEHTEDFVIPKGPRKGEIIKQTVGFSEAHAVKNNDGTIKLMGMIVNENQRGKGLLTSMLDKIVEEAGQPITTSKVFSKDGKAVMEALVKKGFADKIDDGNDYLIHMMRFKGKSYSAKDGSGRRRSRGS